MANDDKFPHTDEEMWAVVTDGAAETLNKLQRTFDGDAQLSLAAIALAMSYLLAITKTPEARRKALYDCVEERVGDAQAHLTPELEKFLHQTSGASKVVH